ncbi:hypothetical protein F5148DRAFT_1161025 [Russula earlei]|uniref:Uncharacterized protein n=1 Tax=Russula earlei TaxID=71964 RepID=A0ACC0UM46_9AGAM|nr:hypothetical protein F5148DRAFT_1161025 [Russula earlei]
MAFINPETLSTIRRFTFATTVVFSLIVICVSADVVSLTNGFFSNFPGFSLATGLITFVTIIPMYFIDSFRQGSVFSYLVVEIGWLTVLWIFWLTSGSYAAWTDDQIIALDPAETSCNFGIFGDGPVSQVCHEIKAIIAFSFLLWLLLMGYTILLLVLGVRAQGGGHSPWKSSVRDGTLLYPAEIVRSPAQVEAAPASFSYPPVPI